MKEVFLLVGPIASGKSYIGRLIENYFDIPFFEYEDIFIEEQKNHPNDFLKLAEPMAEKAIFDFLDRKGKICFENTMVRPYALEIFRKLQQIADVRIIYVNTPIDLTMKRLEQRPKSTHVKWSPEELSNIYDDSKKINLDYDLVLNNTNSSDEEIKHNLQELMSERVWHKDYVKINFKGQKLKFNSWSGNNLTPYDMEYKPWKASFHKENLGYLKYYNLKPGDGASFFFNASPYVKEISAVSIDNELERLGVNKVDFIKMDIEGSEVKAVEGAKKTLTANSVNLAVASYHILNGEETFSAVEDILKKFGYYAKTDFSQHKTTYGYKSN
jgi:dephospho-CoA kinase